jgi:hypothetical protein
MSSYPIRFVQVEAIPALDIPGPYRCFGYYEDGDGSYPTYFRNATAEESEIYREEHVVERACLYAGIDPEATPEDERQFASCC